MDSRSWRDLVFNQGVSDFFHHKNVCPIYWRGTSDAKIWTDGFHFAKRLQR